MVVEGGILAYKNHCDLGIGVCAFWCTGLSKSGNLLVRASVIECLTLSLSVQFLHAWGPATYQQGMIKATRQPGQDHSGHSTPILPST